MTLRSIYRILRLGLVNFWRNRWLSIAATLMMTVTLLIISFFAILNLSVNAVSDSIRSRLDLEVFFYDDHISESKILSLAQDLKKQPNITNVHYVSKSEARDNFKNYELDPSIISQITDDFNPLPRSLKVQVTNPEEIDSVSVFIKQQKYSDIVCKEMKCMTSNSNDNKATTQKLISVTKFIKKVGYSVGALFILVSVLIILNTIRLTIFTRKDEIEIMKLVGANHTFVRYPFVIEAGLYGVIGTIVSLTLISLSVKFTSPYIGKYLKLVNLDMEHFFRSNLLYIILLELLISLLIAVFCSFVTIRKHLKT